MSRALRIRHIDWTQDKAALARLCWEYRAHLGSLGGDVVRAIDRFYPIASYDEMIDALPQKHRRPTGAVLLVERDGDALGCGMIQPLSGHDAEMKRVYIDPSLQGSGAGEALSRALIDQARNDGYSRILLDTTRVSTPARKLYEKLGFQQRGPYSAMPDDLVDAFVYYELTL